MTNMINVELRRRQLKRSKRSLCIAAGIRTSTYYRLLKHPGSGRLSTIVQLDRTLTALEQLKAQGLGHAG